MVNDRRWECEARSMPDTTPQDIDRWFLLTPDDQPPVIALVIDDGQDDEVTAAVAEETMVPSDRFDGLWGSGERDGHYLLAFRLIETAGGVERTWTTDNIHRPLLEAILTVPHLVALLPKELAGDGRTLDDLLPRLQAALYVEVEERSPQVAHVLAERGDR